MTKRERSPKQPTPFAGQRDEKAVARQARNEPALPAMSQSGGEAAADCAAADLPQPDPERISGEETVASVVVFELAPDGTILFANDGVERVTGYQPEELRGRCFDEVFFPQQQRRTIREMCERVLVGNSSSQDVFLTAKNGAQTVLHLFFAGRCGADHTLESVVAFGGEMLKCMWADDMLPRSGCSYLRFLGEFPNPVCRFNHDGRCDYLNEAWLSFTGRAMEQELGDGWRENIHPDDLQRCLDTYLSAFDARAPFKIEYRMRRWDGEYRWIVTLGRPFWSHESEFLGYIGSSYDITEHKQMAETLRRERDFTSAVIDTIGSLVVVLDSERRIVRFNRACEQTTGYSFVEVQGKLLWDLFVPPEELGRFKAMFDELHSGRSPSTCESYWLARDSKRRFISWVNTALVDEQGAVDYIVATGIDMTEHRREEERRARLSVIIDSLPHLVATMSVNGQLLSLNAAGRQLLGLVGEEEISRMQLPHFYPEREREALAQEQITTAVRDGAWIGETTLLGAKGREIPVSQVILAHKTPDGSVDFLSTVAFDVSERLRLGEELRQAQKMEAVGRLAGGLAHDFNNLLMPIMSYSEMLLAELSPADPLRRYAQQIAKTAERAATLPQQLLVFSRKQILEPTVLALGAVVTGMGEMLRRLIGENIEMVITCSPSLGLVKADRGQMEQVIMNLVVNARDAMPDGGKLIIELANVYLDEACAQWHVAMPPGHYVLLAITDTGCGMDKETKSRIFEPFFTTKEMEKGTGLGLSTVYGIVTGSGGHIRVYSEVNFGTTFRIYLPRVNEDLVPPEEHHSAALEVCGSKTILLVEDDEAVRAVLREVLERDGHIVLEARHAQEAFLVIEQDQRPIDLMVTDLIMPGINGGELARRLAQVQPRMKVLYMSGYPESIAAATSGKDDSIVFLQKPFTPNTLACKVREVLGTTNGSDGKQHIEL